jgi:hypothetical protein
MNRRIMVVRWAETVGKKKVSLLKKGQKELQETNLLILTELRMREDLKNPRNVLPAPRPRSELEGRELASSCWSNVVLVQTQAVHQP